MSDVTDEMVQAVVDAEAPYFRRLNEALRRRGFHVAAHLSGHEWHFDEVHSDCPECMAEIAGEPVTDTPTTFHYEDDRLSDGRTIRRPVVDDPG